MSTYLANLTNQKLISGNKSKSEHLMHPSTRIKSLSDDDAFELVDHLRERCRDAKYPLESKWFQNVAFYSGMQDYEPSLLLAAVDPSALWRSEPQEYIANHVIRIVAAQVARMSSAKIPWEVIPNSPDIDDQEAAKVGSNLLQHYTEDLGFRSLRRLAAYWRTICGNAFYEIDYDEQAGRLIRAYVNPVDGTPIRADQLSDSQKQQLESIGGVQERYEGDITMDVLSPFQVYVSPDYTKLDDAPWVMIQYHKSPDWVHDRFPKQAKLLTEDELVDPKSGHYWRALQTLNSSGSVFLGGRDLASQTIEITKFVHAPSARFPGGRVILATKRQVLQNEPHPHAAAELPANKGILRHGLQKVGFHCQPGRFWDQSQVEHLMGPQREYNKARDQVIKQGNLLSRPQWIAPKQTKVASYRVDFGDVWEYEGGFGKPELIQPSGLSPANADSMDRALYDMQTISAQGEASQGQNPAGMRSAAGLQMLQQRDDMVTGPIMEDEESAMSNIGRGLLLLAWKRLDVPRTVRLFGEFQSADVAIFKGLDLLGNVNVSIRPGGMMPQSKAQTMEATMNLLQLGALNPGIPKEKRVILNSMMVGGTTTWFNELDADARRAGIENYMFWKPSIDMQTGLPKPFPDVADFDDHAVHLEEHTKFAKTDAYEQLPPIRKVAFNAHMMKHQQMIAMMVQTQMAMAQSAGPSGSAPKEPGKASQPGTSKGSGPSVGSQQ